MSAPGLIGAAVGALVAQGAAFEALLLTASALHKVVRRRYLKEVVQTFAGVPRGMAPFVLGGVAALEIAAGVLLFLPGLRAPGALVAALVWTAYLVLIVRAIRQGRRDADCGCSFGPARRPLGAFQVTRNLVLLGLAVFVAAGAAGAAGRAAIQGSQILAACALLALYGAVDQLMALQPLRGAELS